MEEIDYLAKAIEIFDTTSKDDYENHEIDLQFSLVASNISIAQALEKLVTIAESMKPVITVTTPPQGILPVCTLCGHQHISEECIKLGNRRA